MISVKEISLEYIEECFELDSKTLSLWSKEQWDKELKKKGIKVFGLLQADSLVGLCVFQVVIDEAQVNYFAINKKFQRQGLGTFLMKFLIEECNKLKINKLLLEVSENNSAAESFYNNFDFITVGIRKNYYSDGSNALLKEKELIKK